ncbi:MAG: hypothetical protein Q9208_001842 [Pyrenodesmia sp. 3 TL-2023]
MTFDIRSTSAILSLNRGQIDMSKSNDVASVDPELIVMFGSDHRNKVHSSAEVQPRGSFQQQQASQAVQPEPESEQAKVTKKKTLQGLRTSAPRLRKAYVGIPCTFTRISKRRGPRNKVADGIREKFAPGGEGHNHSGATSPTYAAHTLASLAQQPVLSADSICPAPLLPHLVDDYFTYVHPLLPIPHEPSFRAALAAREDVKNTTFLALLASMIGYLVTSNPRRPRLHIHGLGMDALFPNSDALIERCRRTAIEARGLGYLDRQQTMDDAFISYLQGMIAAYSFNWDACRLYLGQYVSISRVIGLHKQAGPGSAPVANANEPQRNVLQPGRDVVLQETARRMFWIGFSTIISLQHLGLSVRELNIPPPTSREPYPDLPMETDDGYITPQGARLMPSGEISKLTAFNATVNMYRACSAVSAMELAYGVNEVFNWAQQGTTIKQALDTVKAVFIGLPSELVLAPETLPKSEPQPPQENYPPLTQAYPGFNRGQIPVRVENPNVERRKMQFGVQRLNIVATEIATRCTLMDKYSRLSDAVRDRAQSGQHLVDDIGSDRDIMIKDFLRMIRDLDLTYLEPAGLGFTNKLRQVVAVLEETPQHRRSEFHHRVQRYVVDLVDYLADVQRVGPNAAEALNVEGFNEEDLRSRQWTGLLQSMNEFV